MLQIPVSRNNKFLALSLLSWPGLFWHEFIFKTPSMRLAVCFMFHSFCLSFLIRIFISLTRLFLKILFCFVVHNLAVGGFWEGFIGFSKPTASLVWRKIEGKEFFLLFFFLFWQQNFSSKIVFFHNLCSKHDGARHCKAFLEEITRPMRGCKPQIIRIFLWKNFPLYF